MGLLKKLKSLGTPQKTWDDHPYAAWDRADFRLYEEWKLNEASSLADALYVFYAAGGYDFFEVIDADCYASNWLNFVGGLYTAVENGVYQKGESHFRFPLSDEVRRSLIEQGVPPIFTTDF